MKKLNSVWDENKNGNALPSPWSESVDVVEYILRRLTSCSIEICAIRWLISFWNEFLISLMNKVGKPLNTLHKWIISKLFTWESMKYRRKGKELFAFPREKEVERRNHQIILWLSYESTLRRLLVQMLLSCGADWSNHV